MRTRRNVGLSEKVAYLRQPEAFPDRPDSVQALETHFAWVFLSDRFAYKLKKPVRAPEFDLTSVQSRRINCELEVALNRRLAAETYIGVVPLGCYGGQLGLERDTHPIDWLVKMHRLPNDLTLERQLPQMTTDDPRLALLLDTLCDFYGRAVRAPWTEEDYIDELEKQCSSIADRLQLPALESERALVRRVAEQQRAFIGERNQLLHERLRHGRVRDVHGDLRPEHVFLTKRPQIIDCLEFSTELRQLDSAEEISFLALECERLGRSDIGLRLLMQYREACDDAVPRDLFAFYLSRRALVRAYLSIWHLEDWLGDAQARHWADQAVWYLGRAARAIEQACRPDAVSRIATG